MTSRQPDESPPEKALPEKTLHWARVTINHFAGANTRRAPVATFDPAPCRK